MLRHKDLDSRRKCLKGFVDREPQNEAQLLEQGRGTRGGDNGAEEATA